MKTTARLTLAVIALVFTLLSCNKELLESPHAENSTPLILKITGSDSQGNSPGVLYYQTDFLYDAQNRLIKTTERDSGDNISINIIEYKYKGADTLPYEHYYSCDGRLERRVLFTYTGGVVTKDSLITYLPQGGISTKISSNYFDTADTYAQVWTSYDDNSTYCDTAGITDMVKASNGNLIEWTEFENKFNYFRFFEASYSTAANPFYYYSHRNLYFYAGDQIETSYGFLIPLLHHDSKNAMLHIREYSIDGTPGKKLEREDSYEYGYDPFGKTISVTYRCKRTNGWGETRKALITYKN